MADVAERTGTDLYKADEHAWIEHQVAALRCGDFDDLDCENLIEFLTSMAFRDERELESRLIVLRAHIIKMQIQPDKVTGSWRLAIAEQQRAIKRLLKKLPSLRAQADDILSEVFGDATASAVEETGAVGDFIIDPIDFEGVLSFNPWA